MVNEILWDQGHREAHLEGLLRRWLRLQRQQAAAHKQSVRRLKGTSGPERQAVVREEARRLGQILREMAQLSRLSKEVIDECEHAVL